MLGLALRGLASRKLRAALTALAIMLGVAMVAGTFMLKGSVDKAFDDIFAEANAGIDVTVQPKSAFDSGFDLPGVGRGPAGVAGRQGRGRRRGREGVGRDLRLDLDRDPRRERRSDRARRRRPAADRPERPAGAVQPVHLDRGRGAGDRRRGRHRLDHRRRGGLRGRPEDHDQRRPRRQGLHAVGDRPVRLRRARSAAPASRSSRSPRRRRSPARRASSTASRSRPPTASRPTSCRRSINAILPKDRRGEDRRRGRRAAVGRHQGRLQLPDHVPARLRRASRSSSAPS